MCWGSPPRETYDALRDAGAATLTARTRKCLETTPCTRGKSEAGRYPVHDAGHDNVQTKTLS